MALPLSSIPKPVTTYTTTLASKILKADTSLNVETATDDAGNAISGVVGVKIDSEFMIGTKSGVAITGLLRGIDPQDGTSEVVALKDDHQRGATVTITDAPFVVIAYRLLNGTEGFPNKLKYPSATTPTLGQYHLPDWDYVKAYADALAIAGAPDASTTAKGIVEKATSAELAAGTATGATGAPLFVCPDILQPILQAAVSTYVVEDGTGSDDTYTGTATPTLTAYTSGQMFRVTLTVANTGACTLNLDSLGAKDIQKYASGALAALETGDVIANQPVWLHYDGTRFVMMNPGGTMPTTALLSEMATFFTTSNMTGAQSNTLSAGPTSNADNEHVHDWNTLRYKNEEAGYIYILGSAGEGLTATGSPSRGVLATTISTSAAPANAALSTQINSALTAIDWDNDFDLTFVWKQDGAGYNQYNFLGINGNDIKADVPNSGTDTAKHVGFYFVDSVLYASVASGTTQTRTDISSGVTFTNINVFRIAKTASQVLFYVNGTLKTTTTTNLPSGSGNMFLEFACERHTSGSNSYYLANNYVYRVKTS